MTGILPESFSFSQSSLQTYLNCPYQFYLRYIANLRWPAPQTDDQLEFEKDRLAGTRLHQLAHQYFLGINPAVLRQMAKNDSDPRLFGWFDSFIETFGQSLSGRLYSEHTLQVRIDKYPLMAKYDLLQHDEKHLTIYDWKTSRKRPSDTWLKSQLQSHVFPLVLSNYVTENLGLSEASIEMVYWEVTSPEKTFVIQYLAEQAAADKQMVKSLMQKIASSEIVDFQKTSDIKYCRYCQFRSHCNRGIKAGNYQLVEEYSLVEPLTGQEQEIDLAELL
ncbi:MAG: RecB family exonuclease [Anaerolineaceae bacterium]|jgi:CRISPR/Cas system-associated exonuclease Cas4 (RecB family)